MASGEEKTEPATPKKKREAREQGDVANSREVATVMLLAVMWVGASSAIGANLLRTVAEQSVSVWSGAEIHPHTEADFHALLWVHGCETGMALAPIALLIILSGVISSVAQIGVMFSPKALQFRLNRIRLMQGLKRLLNKDKLMELGKAAIKIGLLAATVWLTLRSDLAGLYTLVDATVWQSLAKGGELSGKVWLASLVILSFVAIADFYWVRHRHAKKLRMTKKEVRDERKQREGDPQIKSRLRQMQRDFGRQRMIAEVAEADVVVTNPTHFAVALRYQQAMMTAPKVIAKGRGYVALRIREVALENDVPIVENPPLAQLLYKTAPVGREVPENLYQAVAEVLAYVYRLRPRAPDMRRAS